MPPVRTSLQSKPRLICCVEENVKLAMKADQRKQSSYFTVDGSLSAAELELVPIVADEEFLPLQPGSIDLALSNLSLHWVNELQDTLSQVRLHSAAAVVPSAQLFPTDSPSTETKRRIYCCNVWW